MNYRQRAQNGGSVIEKRAQLRRSAARAGDELNWRRFGFENDHQPHEHSRRQVTASSSRISDALTIPEYSGNRYMNTLGNLLGEPRASLLFVDFDRGDLLHLQGRVGVDWACDAATGLPGAERSWRFHVARAWRRPDALRLDCTFLDFAPTTARVAEPPAPGAAESS